MLGFAGALYAAIALLGGATFVGLALRLHRSRGTNRQAAHRLFAFSIVYLFVLFAALLASSGANRGPASFSTRVAPTDVTSMQTGSPARPVRIARRIRAPVPAAAEVLAGARELDYDVLVP